MSTFQAVRTAPQVLTEHSLVERSAAELSSILKDGFDPVKVAHAFLNLGLETPHPALVDGLNLIGQNISAEFPTNNTRRLRFVSNLARTIGELDTGEPPDIQKTTASKILTDILTFRAILDPNEARFYSKYLGPMLFNVGKESEIPDALIKGASTIQKHARLIDRFNHSDQGLLFPEEFSPLVPNLPSRHDLSFHQMYLVRALLREGGFSVESEQQSRFHPVKHHTASLRFNYAASEILGLAERSNRPLREVDIHHGLEILLGDLAAKEFIDPKECFPKRLLRSPEALGHDRLYSELLASIRDVLSTNPTPNDRKTPMGSPHDWVDPLSWALFKSVVTHKPTLLHDSLDSLKNKQNIFRLDSLRDDLKVLGLSN